VDGYAASEDHGLMLIGDLQTVARPGPHPVRCRSSSTDRKHGRPRPPGRLLRAAASMTVAISGIARELDTTVAGAQTAIALFTLFMASLMIPGSKLTDIWGRKRCLVAGLALSDDLHPDHRGLPRRQDAGQVLRCGQQHRRTGRRDGPADR
jgi:hypothetical protein